MKLRKECFLGYTFCSESILNAVDFSSARRAEFSPIGYMGWFKQDVAFVGSTDRDTGCIRLQIHKRCTDPCVQMVSNLLKVRRQEGPKTFAWPHSLLGMCYAELFIEVRIEMQYSPVVVIFPLFRTHKIPPKVYFAARPENGNSRPLCDPVKPLFGVRKL